MSAGWYHSLALKNDGTVWAWGSNGSGQLGDGTTTMRTTPVQVSGLTGVIAIAGGVSHTVALKSDGTVWAWGANDNGQLGDGTTTQRVTPIRVAGLAAVTAIGAGFSESLAVRNDGTLWAWGSNDYGQLGDGTTTARYSPVQVGGISGAKAATAGYCDMVVLKADGTVWGCGYNIVGELGDGTTNQRNTCVQMTGVSGAVAVACESFYGTLVLKGDGSVWGCGQDGYGQIGDGASTVRTNATQATALGDCVFSVAATANPLPTYQWQRQPAGQTGFSNLTDGASYSGSTTAALHVVAPTSAMSGDQFRCVVTNSAGSVTSAAAALVIGPPTVTIVGGNNQSAAPSSFNAHAFDAAVWNAAGTQPLMGTPITFTVQSGGGMLATTNTGSPSLLSSITLNTDIDGTAQVFYQQPATAGTTSQIVASSGGGQITFTTQAAAPGSPPSAPAALRTATSGPSSISFSWGSSIPQGSATINGYNIYRNGTLLNGTPLLSTSYSDTTVAAGTAYSYTVKAVDSTGAVSAAASLNVSAPTLSTSGTFDVLTPTP